MIYTDFMQLLTQDETISGLCLHTYTLTNLVIRYPGFAVPLMFASNLLKGMINQISHQHRVTSLQTFTYRLTDPYPLFITQKQFYRKQCEYYKIFSYFQSKNVLDLQHFLLNSEFLDLFRIVVSDD